jgi:DNA polymerase-3 subunit alpha
MPDFVHLHTHTEFSLLDGLSKPRALAQQAADLGMDALAITDHGVMFGIVDFYQACQDVGIKPILGFEAYIARKSRHIKDRSESKAYHLVLLAQNQTGYENLLKLASIAQLEGFYYKPRIDKEVLAQHSEGVIVLSACLQGEVPRLLLQNQPDQAREVVRWYQEHFPGRYYLEIQDHEIPEQRRANRMIIDLAREMDVPLVATNDIHYAKREQANAHDVLLCIQTGKTVNEPNRMRMSDPSYYMRSPEEMAQIFPEVPDALANTAKIAEQCGVELEFAPPYHLPKFPVPEDCGSSEEYLRHLCYEGLKWRYGERADEPEIVERLDYELGIINEMGFDDYFLIVWDLCKASKRRDIWWNVRGSGAGSVVAYTLGITHIDPLKNRLMFERFLNPARVNMPDIDLDYPDDRRDELIAYTKEKYGADHVSAIITFGTLGARAAIRDVGRAMDIPLNEVDRVARLVPNVPGKAMSIAQALEDVPDLKELYDDTPYIKKLLDTAQEVEGVSRHASTHAAGILVSDKPLMEYLPLHRPTRGDGDSPIDSVSQWPMEVVDAMGMLKVDFLGLRTLTHMRKTCELIEQEADETLNLFNIPYERTPDDPETDAKVQKLYELLTSGETTGVFQVEGAGMRRTLQNLRPSQFQHIVAVLALYRPGPMDHIPKYIRRLHGEEEVEYRHEVLEDILSDTYGIIVYQEQIMQIAVAMAGYNPGEADKIRKAVAKKKKKLMAWHKKKFRKGAIEKGFSEEVANAVWGDIEFFARYGFNRAHATDYAVITGQTAYLKAHYPLEFMTALMTTERNNIEKVGFLITDARRNGIEVRGPNINESEIEFSIGHDPDGHRYIRIGLGAIKNVGDDAVRAIVEEREAHGAFDTLDELADRVDLRKLNRRMLEYLIQAGAFDDFGERPALLTMVEAILGASSRIHEARDVGQFTLFDDFAAGGETLKAPDFYPPIPNRKLLEWEKELLGTYLSEHPLEKQEKELLEENLISTTIAQLPTERAGQQLSCVGMVRRVRRITTKKGDPMAFVTLEGPGGTVDVVVFPRTYERCKELLTIDRVLVVSGKLDNRQDREEHALLADWFKEPHALMRAAPQKSPVSGYNPYVEGSDDPAAHEAATEYANDGGTPKPPSKPQPKPARRGKRRASGNGSSKSAHNDSQKVTSPTQRSQSEKRLSKAPPPPEPPSEPATLYITVHRTPDQDADYRKLTHIHRLLQTEEGEDDFIIRLENGSRTVELRFPSDHTRCTPALQQQLREVVGKQNLRVVNRQRP